MTAYEFRLAALAGKWRRLEWADSMTLGRMRELHNMLPHFGDHEEGEKLLTVISLTRDDELQPVKDDRLWDGDELPRFGDAWAKFGKLCIFYNTDAYEGQREPEFFERVES